MQSRLKVLISAYACEPDKGSEPEVGWNWVQQAARLHDVWAITRSTNREAIERAERVNSALNVHWIYFDLPRWARLFKRGNRGVHLYYALWQVGVYFIARRLHSRIHFDVLHHATFAMYWMPSFLGLLRAPFVWGPVGGGESSPSAFYGTFSLRGRVYELLRDVARRLTDFNPLSRVIAKRTAVALASTQQSALRVKNLGAPLVAVMSQVALHEKDLLYLAAMPIRRGGLFRVVSIGSLLHWKGFHLGLAAFARLLEECPAAEYWIIGEGPERKRLKKQAKDLGISAQVRFWGRLSRATVLEMLQECHVLLHPSLHDSGGYVCAEALAAGRPVVCLDLGGPAILVPDAAGYKVPAHSSEQVVSDISRALINLAMDPRLRKDMARAGRQLSWRTFNWDLKGNYMHELYKSLALPQSHSSMPSVSAAMGFTLISRANSE